jgi:tetraacyldisaccharide 4'-kinase
MRSYFYDIVTDKRKDLLAFLIKLFLLCLSFIYFLVIKSRLILYGLRIFKTHDLKRPVISVGNITWGGSGKTPLAEAICLYFKSRGKRAALLTRGYGMDENRALIEDMPGVLVLAGKDRVKNARLAQEKEQPELFVLDDGFQHMRIRRDLDIIAINATDPFGRSLLIPAGILREPLSHISRADLAVITRADLVERERLGQIKEKILKLNPDIKIFEAIHQPAQVNKSNGQAVGLEYIRGKKICALSGLGDNRSFALTLQGLGADIRFESFYMDHHHYTKAELEKVIERCMQDSIGTIVTTGKDWVKLKELQLPVERIEFLVLKIRLKVKDEEDFFRRLSSLLYS